MCLYTADGWEGTLDYNCPEGDLEWVLIKELESLNLWEGDRVFFSAFAGKPSVFFPETGI